jgi:predicted  nucleic acid-binding Zn-ribbon protein
MPTTHFNGILKEIIEQYPNIDLTGFLADKLQLPLDKAEALATRIEKQYLQKRDGTEQKLRLLQKAEETDVPRPSGYPLDSLSKSEFDYFIQWLLEREGVKIDQKNQSTNWVSLVAKKDDQKVAVQAVLCPKTHHVTEAIIPILQETKRLTECQRAIAISTAHFTEQAKAEAEKLRVELWDIDALVQKISELNEKADKEVQVCFPKYEGSLLQSLLALEENKTFLVAAKAEGKYDIHLPGVKYPLLTFQAQNGRIVRCVFRIKYNEPVNENDGEVLIGFDDSLNRTGQDEAQVYEAIIQYLEQFLE